MLKYLPSRNVNPTYPVVQGQSYIIHRCVVFVKYTYSRPDDRDLEKSRRTNQCRFSQACKTQTTFWPVANCCLLRSHFFWITGWYILKSHKLRRVTLCAQEPPAIHVIQNLFFSRSFLSSEASNQIWVTQELFVAARALRSIATPCNWPEIHLVSECFSQILKKRANIWRLS